LDAFNRVESLQAALAAKESELAAAVESRRKADVEVRRATGANDMRNIGDLNRTADRAGRLSFCLAIGGRRHNRGTTAMTTDGEVEQLRKMIDASELDHVDRSTWHRGLELRAANIRKADETLNSDAGTSLYARAD